MKKYLFNLLTLLTVAAISSGLAACGSDDDDNGGGNGGGGNATVKVGNQTVSTNHAYWLHASEADGDWHIQFCNYDANALYTAAEKEDYQAAYSIIPEKINQINIDFVAPGYTGSTLPTGEFDTFVVMIIKDVPRDGSDDGDGYEGIPNGTTGKLKIEKNGDNYTISYSGVNLYYGDNMKDFWPDTSFSYTGNLTKYIGDEFYF
ncbi:MAG: hypothetical protein IJ868_07625 [Prevotella sp.]|nr:hypothetical protein [Prevotella sp.]